MRRSAAPSQLGRTPRFVPPVKLLGAISGNQSEHLLSSGASKPYSPVHKEHNDKGEYRDENEQPLSKKFKPRTTKDILAILQTSSSLASSGGNIAASSENAAASHQNVPQSICTEIINQEFCKISPVNVTSSHCSIALNAESNQTSINNNKRLDYKNNEAKCFRSPYSSVSSCATSSLTEQGSNAYNNETSNLQTCEQSDAGTRYFSVVWCKRSTRKHKKWEGDAVLIVKSRTVTLKDLEGKIIGQSSGYKLADLASLEDGNTLPVGGKEIEIQGSISSADYSSGRCFLGSSSSSSADATSTPSLHTVTLPRPKPKPFKLPTKGSTLSNNASAGNHRSGEPLYRIGLEHSLVFPRPSAQQQFRRSVGVVDVVLDPILSCKLRPHQRDGVLFLYHCVMATRDGADGGGGCILADEMGLGKTLQCIALVWTLLKQSPWSDCVGGAVKRVLIVTPSSLVNNWGKEFNKWLGKERISVFLVHQNNRADDFLRQNVSRVLIISYDMFLRSHAALSTSSAGFGLVICDEAHRLKNSSSKCTSLLAAMPTQRRVLLTGIPLQNDLQELYSLLDFVSPGALCSSAAFRRVYEEPIVTAQQSTASQQEKQFGADRVTELNKITSQFVLRRTQDIINRYLPPKIESVVFCAPSAGQQQVYSDVTTLLSRSLLSPGGGVDHLAAIMLLRKLCNHPALISKGNATADLSDSSAVQLATEASSLLPEYLQQENPTYFEEDSGKLAVLSCMLWQLSSEGNERVVVVSNFTSTLDLLQQLCQRYDYTFLRLDGSTPQHKRQPLVDSFNSKYSKHFVFLLSSRAGGVGLNLIGASRIILYDIDWNPATDLQAMARVWRDGQTRTVHIYRLLLCGSVEERMFQRQVHKQSLSGAVVDARQSSSAKVVFSQQELKDLFSNRMDGSCLTHDQLRCDCDLQGGLPQQYLQKQAPASPAAATAVRACQLSTTVKKSQGSSGEESASSCSMDQLYQWRHYAPHKLTPGTLQDTCLEAASDFVSLVMRNECVSAAAPVSQQTQYSESN
uniref:DNA repair and recombination protein RAD54-like n=1 Tax=Hirondellea gigas TaxID=1518452 RepID=A0A6A7FTU6_9CRUS